MPSKPPSPSDVTPGTEPTLRVGSPTATRTTSAFVRSLTSALPSGKNATPHGTPKFVARSRGFPRVGSCRDVVGALVLTLPLGEGLDDALGEACGREPDGAAGSGSSSRLSIHHTTTPAMA